MTQPRQGGRWVQPGDDVGFQIRSEGVVWRSMGDDVVALELGSSTYLHLNLSGALLWNRMADQETERADLVEALVVEYGITRDRAEEDVERFLATLTEYQLLES